MDMMNTSNEYCTMTDTTYDPPMTETTCNTDVVAGPCPEPVKIEIQGCEDFVEFHAGDVELDSFGRVLQLDVTLKNVCPHKRVALAVVLKELDEKNQEFQRGLKTLLIPAHDCPSCRDIKVRCIKFVLPETLDVSGDTTSLCGKRRFNVRFFANYIDNDFECCHQVTV